MQEMVVNKRNHPGVVSRIGGLSAIVLLGLAVLGGCATSPKKLAVCDGHHLRDVNIYGSALPGSPIPGVTAPPAVPPVPPLAHPPTDAPGPPPPVPEAAPPSPNQSSAIDRRDHPASC